MKGYKGYLYVNALSSLGSRMDLIASSALIFTFADSVYWLSAFFVARQIGGMMFSMAAGILADRMDRRRAMLISDIGAGLAILLVLLFPHPYVIVGAAFVKGMLYSLFHISFQASLPQMFGRDALVNINGLTVRLESIVGIAGFALGGLLTDSFGYAVVIAFDAATFFVSAIVLMRLRWENDEQQERSTADRFWLGATYAYLAKHPVLLTVSLLAFFEALSTASHNYGLPFLAEMFIPKDAVLHGGMWSLMSVGAWAGTYLASHLRSHQVASLFAASFLLALTISLSFAGSQLWIVLLFLGLAGMFTGVTQVCRNTILQAAESRIRGRVMGVQSTVSRGGFFVGFLAWPSVVGYGGLSGMVISAQAIFAGGMMLLIAYLYMNRKKV
ncbi:MAG TPA: MFS transporter [Brevibacillus sp.]|nr:MFS transporter [Brevibacillus sp.]